MKKIISRITAASLAAAMTLTLSSCGKKGDVIASKEHVFAAEKLEMPEELDGISKILYSNEKLYILGYHSWSEPVKNDDGKSNGTETDNSDSGAETDNSGTAQNITDEFDDIFSELAATEISSPGILMSSLIAPSAAFAVETAVTAVSNAAEDAAEDVSEDVSEDVPENVSDKTAVPEEVLEPVEEIWHSETKLYVMSLDGTLENEVVLSTNESEKDDELYISSNIYSITVDKSGGLAAIKNQYTYNSVTSESSEKYFLVRYADDGTVIAETSLEKLIESVEDDYFWIDDFIPTNSGKYLLHCNSSIYIVDENGSFLGKLKYEGSSNDTWLWGLYESGDGRIFTTVSITKRVGNEYENEQKLVEIDVEGAKFGEEYPIKIGSAGFMNGTEKYDLLVTRDSGLAGYNIQTGETEVIIDWLKSGFDVTAMVQDATTVLPDGRVLCVTYDYQYNGGGYSYGNDMIISILTEIPPEEIPDKKLIKLYALYLSTDIKRQILEFNKNNIEYEIELTSYEDYEDGATRMNNDMIAGNLPDIIILNQNMPIDSYISKGLLADIYEYIDNDPDMNRSDFIENLFKAYEVGGKLYEIIPSFSIVTLAAKTSLVGEEQGWTMDEFIDFADSHPDAKSFSDFNTKSDVLTSFINVCYNSYIDNDTGKCRFDSDEFIRLLEFCNRFPKEIPDNFWDSYDRSAQEDDLRTGKRLFSEYHLNRFGSIREMEYATFGEPITFKGYPGADGSGSAFSSYTEIAITSKANNTEGAWSFVKYFLSEEYQDIYATNQSYNFPIRVSSLEKQAEAFKERRYWLNSDGTKEYWDNTYWIAGNEIKIGENTDEDNKKVLDFIYSVDSVSRYNTEITSIITEEAAAYFEGQKSAADVAETIQNRVSNYIAEKR